MTIINPNSISGISSITALNSTAAINLFKADGTSANIIAGVTTGSNFITGTSNVHSTGYECTNINASGIVTATTFVGNLTGNPTGTLQTAAQPNITSVGTLSALGVAGDVTITSTDAGSSAAPIINLFRNSASPADADYLGQIKFQGESDTGVQRNYAKITGKILDASNGTEDGILEFAHIKGGSQTITGRWRSDSLQLLNSTNFSVAGTSTLTGDVDIDGNTTFGANGSITSAANFHLSSNQLRVTGGSTVVGEFRGTSIPTVQVTQTTNNSDLQLRANSEGGLVRTASNYPLILGANQREKLRIAGGSYATIGINTSTFDTAGSQIKIEGRGAGTTSPPYLQIKGVGNANLHSYIDLIATSDSNAGNSYRGLGIVMHDEPTNVEWFAGRPYAGSDRFIIGRKTPASYRTESSEVANQLFRLDSDGKLTLGDGNELAPSYGANLLIDGGSGSQLTLIGSTNGWSKISFADGSGSTGAKNAGFIYMQHSTTNNGPNLSLGLQDVNKVLIRDPGSNRGQLELYGNFNESTVPAIEINDSGDARKVFLTNSSGDFNVLTRNGSQTKGQLKMFESGILIHNMKDPDSTNVLQTLRAGVYKVTTGSTYTSISPITHYIIKGGSGTYDCFEEGNCELEVNGSSSNDHFQPVGFVPRGYNLDATSFGGQWAGEMWIHQVGSQNPVDFGYDSSSYNTWATMSFKCKWDSAHWNAKPNGFWVEHYINTGRQNIGKIDASGTQSQFVIYLLPGRYKIRYNAVRGVSVHRPVSDGAALVMRDGGSFVTYNTLAYSSRNTAFGSEITAGSSGAHTT